MCVYSYVVAVLYSLMFLNFVFFVGIIQLFSYGELKGISIKENDVNYILNLISVTVACNFLSDVC